MNSPITSYQIKSIFLKLYQYVQNLFESKSDQDKYNEIYKEAIKEIDLFRSSIDQYVTQSEKETEQDPKFNLIQKSDQLASMVMQYIQAPLSDEETIKSTMREIANNVRDISANLNELDDGIDIKSGGRKLVPIIEAFSTDSEKEMDIENETKEKISQLGNSRSSPTLLTSSRTSPIQQEKLDVPFKPESHPSQFNTSKGNAEDKILILEPLTLSGWNNVKPSADSQIASPRTTYRGPYNNIDSRWGIKPRKITEDTKALNQSSEGRKVLMSSRSESEITNKIRKPTTY